MKYFLGFSQVTKTCLRLVKVDLVDMLIHMSHTFVYCTPQKDCTIQKELVIFLCVLCSTRLQKIQ